MGLCFPAWLRSDFPGNYTDFEVFGLEPALEGSCISGGAPKLESSVFAASSRSWKCAFLAQKLGLTAAESWGGASGEAGFRRNETCQLIPDPASSKLEPVFEKMLSRTMPKF